MPMLVMFFMIRYGITQNYNQLEITHMKVNILGILFSALVFAACDDTTSTLGQEVMPEGDRVEIKVDEYDVSTGSILAESLLAKTTTAYLGKYTDPYSQTIFETDFMAQFNCLEDFEFPEKAIMKKEEDGTIKAKLTELRLYYSTYFGDSLNVQTLEVYPLTNRLKEDETYYTDVNPADFYNEKSAPIAVKTYSAVDLTVKDSLRWTSTYYPNVRVLSDKLTDFGTEMINKFYTNKDYYANAEAFIDNICKGFYFKCKQGDGTVLNIDQAHLNVYFDYYIKSSSGAIDSLVTGVAQFSATPEVIQANRFKTDNLKTLIENEECTYLQTPAGIFTEITLPIDDLSLNDTINSAQLILTKYNHFNDEKYQMNTPQTLLMVPKGDMYKFFENNKVPDNKTSYYTSYSSSYNQYDFNNIAYLINTLRSKKRNDPTGYNKDPEWNKVVLIPITMITQTINNQQMIVNVRHDLQMGFAKLKGNKDKLKLKVIYSKFKDMN